MPEPQPVELLVIGGGPAGHHAVRVYREAGGAGTVALVSADDAAPYHRPPLSKDYLRGAADDEDLPIEAESWYADNDIDLVLNSSVEELEPAARIARAGSGRTVAISRLRGSHRIRTAGTGTPWHRTS